MSGRRKGLFWWPFGRKHRKTEPGDIIPIYDTDFEGTIKLILEKARSRAQGRPSGTEIVLDARELLVGRSLDPMEVLGPVMFRAHQYGLLPGVYVNGKFHFEKI